MSDQLTETVRRLDLYDAARNAGAMPSRLQTLAGAVKRASGCRTIREARAFVRARKEQT